MHALVAFLFFLAQPFWEARPPEQWTDREIEAMRRASPWAQAVGPPPVLLVYLTTAAPVEQAEAAGLSYRTLVRAKTALRVKSRKASMGAGWFWFLSGTDGGTQ